MIGLLSVEESLAATTLLCSLSIDPPPVGCVQENPIVYNRPEIETCKGNTAASDYVIRWKGIAQRRKRE